MGGFPKLEIKAIPRLTAGSLGGSSFDELHTGAPHTEKHWITKDLSKQKLLLHITLENQSQGIPWRLYHATELMEEIYWGRERTETTDRAGE